VEKEVRGEIPTVRTGTQLLTLTLYAARGCATLQVLSRYFAMKPHFLLVSLLVATVSLTSCKDDTPAAASSSYIPAHLQKVCAWMEELMNDKQKAYFRAGVLGDASKEAEPENKKSAGLNDAYFCGVALGGHTELVKQMLEKGADPSRGLSGVASGGPHEPRPSTPHALR